VILDTLGQNILASWQLDCKVDYVTGSEEDCEDTTEAGKEEVADRALERLGSVIRRGLTKTYRLYPLPLGQPSHQHVLYSCHL
jgi:hypothetical protein